MSKVDLALYSKNIVIGNQIKEGYILISDEKILDIVSEFDKKDTKVENYDNFTIIPGIVDCHVHINEPGRTDWEGFETATKAALAGGITTLIDMPLNCSPVTTSVKNLNIKTEEVKNKLWVDCGFWGGIIPDNFENIEPLLKAGVMGCKVFLIDSGIDEFPNVSEDDLRKALPLLKKYDLPLIVHAEIEDYPGQTSDYNDPKSYKAFLDSRPKNIEDKAVAMMIRLCDEFDTRIHIVHLSSSGSLEQIKEAKEKGLKFSAETCPHYLFFNSEDINDGDTKFKCCPPIREKENNDLLWDGLKSGIIDFVVSDHSPCTANLKLMEKEDIEHAWGGISGLQFSFSVILTEAIKRGFNLNQVVQLMSENTAKFLGINHKKGKIAKGLDADLVILDPNEEFTIEEEIIQHKNKVTPYIDKNLKGVVKKTYVRGRLAYDQGNFIDSPTGQFLFK